MLDEWQIFAISSLAIFLKMFGTMIVQVLARISNKTFSNPEDAEMFGGQQAPDAVAELDRRAAAVFRNDADNVPVFMFLQLAYIQLGAEPIVQAAIAGTFVLARLLHTISYLCALQPWRGITFFAGMGCSWALVILLAQRLLAYAQF